jgi:hypothetical protein
MSIQNRGTNGIGLGFEIEGKRISAYGDTGPCLGHIVGEGIAGCDSKERELAAEGRVDDKGVF